MSWGIYIVECTDGMYFSGRSQDIDRQINLINKGFGGSFFTNRGRTPVKLVYKEENLPFREAFAKSRYLKTGMYTGQKKRLIKTGRWPYGGPLREYLEKHSD